MRAVSVNMAAVYLGPFLALIAAGMLSRAMTGDFEWAYPLHLLAVCVVFLIYSRQYMAMNWRFTWRGPAAGLLAFAIWMSFEWLTAGLKSGAAPAALDAAIAPVRWSWISARVLGAVVAVPFAEELAFRSYLMRRLVTEEFDRLPPAQVTLLSLTISSVLFGVLHGERWLAGILAGLLYGLVYMRKGRLADAVVAHATTNGLIAVAVLGWGYWKLW
jgi:CAAX prenyl protease-like protein